MNRFVAALAGALTLAAPAYSGDLTFRGFSFNTANDSIGEGKDRWQSSVLQGNLYFGPKGAAPETAGLFEFYEIRLRSQIMTPENLEAPQPGDRPFAGVLSVGLLTHGFVDDYGVTLGSEIAVVGPQTGTFRFQRWLHDQFGFARPNTSGNEIEDGVHGGVFAEVGRTFGDELQVRPFVEIRAGIETLARAGIDFTWGDLGRDDILVREQVTGQRVPGLLGPDTTGFSFMAGFDVAHVERSIYLPANRGLELEPRGRIRLGVNRMSENWSLFYGLTYLTPEFEAQPEGQFLGAAQIRYRF